MKWGRKLTSSGFNRRQEGARFALLFGSSLMALSQLDRIIVSVVRGPVREELHLSNAEIAIPDTFYNALYLIFGLLAGVALDTGLDRRLILGGGLVLWSLATSLTAFSPNLIALVVCDALVGLAEGAVHTALVPFVAEFYPARERGLVFAVIMTSAVLGSGLGFIIGGSLAGALGWRLMYFLCGLPGVFVSATVLFLNDPAAGVNDQVVANAEESFSLSGSLCGWFDFFRYPHFMVALSATTAYLFVSASFHAYLPEYLSQYGGFSVAQASVVVGVSLIGGLCGTPAGSKIAAILEESLANATFVICACSLLCNALCGLLVINVHAGVDVLAAFLTMWSFFGSAVVAPAMTLSVNAVPVHLRGRAQGLWGVFTKVLGAVPSVLFFGSVADSYGLPNAMQLTWLTTLAPAALWLLGYFCTPTLRDFAVNEGRKNTTASDDTGLSFASLMHLEPPEPSGSGDGPGEYGTF